MQDCCPKLSPRDPDTMEDFDQPGNIITRPGGPHSHAYSYSHSSGYYSPIMAMDVSSEAIPRNFTMSKLPSYRAVDLGPVGPSLGASITLPQPKPQKENNLSQSASDAAGPTMLDSKPKNMVVPRSNHNAVAPRLSRNLTFPIHERSLDNSGLPIPKIPKTRATPVRNQSVSQGRINKQKDGPRPPQSMITRGYYNDQGLEDNNTTQWVAQQQSTLNDSQGPTQHEGKSAEAAAAQSSLRPARGLRSSSRKSMSRRSSVTSPEDETIRAFEGLDDNISPRNSVPHHRQHQTEQDELTASDESDLFLNAARAEEKMARQTNSNLNSPSRIDTRYSRASLPRDSLQEKERPKGSRPMEEQESIAQALTYSTAKDRPTAPEDVSRNRYTLTTSRSNPTTPRLKIFKGESSPELPGSYVPRRAIPESSLSARSAYRQSNLSYTTPRVYNSSPLVSRITDMDEIPETTRAAEGTESSVSTTAPSTVWDELEDLKSRIHRLELTGKLPPTSGAAMSRASHDRPPTATTTVTTTSTSPKRARGNSIAKSVAPDERKMSSQTDSHPLLHDALAKSKPLLSAEVFKALEAATTDALAIASMMGTSGQLGPISSSQSTVGGPATVSDRQVRRKADSMCRSLTELCLALSEAQPGSLDSGPSAAPQPSLLRPTSKGRQEVRQSIELPAKRPLAATDFLRAQSTPRALSRLEERRNSLLATRILPSPRYNPSEVGTSLANGRRTSLFLRTARTAPPEQREEREEGGDEFLFRAPSRAGTEIGRLRDSPREYTPKQSVSGREPAILSSLPVRRHYTSTSLVNTITPPMPPVSNLGGRRFLDRATPERDTSSVVSRINEVREQRKSSIGGGYLGRSGSLTKKSRQSTPNDSPSAAQTGNYQ